jgi:hypothetical protein
MVVTSADGKKCGVNIGVNPSTVYHNTLNQIADGLRISRDRIERILADRKFGPDQLRRHLEQFPAEVLDSPANMRAYVNHPHAQP